MRLAFDFALTLVTSVATACGSPSLEPDAGAPHDASTAAPDASLRPIDAGSDAGPPEDPPSEQLVALYENVIVRHCGGDYCHAPGGPNDFGWVRYRPTLRMPDPATARAVLVNQRLDCLYSDDRRIRVVPYDPAASAIMLAGTDGLCGLRHNNAVPDLTEADLAQIERWISYGAR